MNVMRFQPWTLMDVLHRDFDRFSAPRPGANGHVSDNADWVPAVDIVEEQERFVIRADLPGVDADDIDINMDDGVLSLAGERRGETREESHDIRRVERFVGRFSRRFSLPETADAEGISARSSNGILEVAIPKLPEVKARRITVEAA